MSATEFWDNIFSQDREAEYGQIAMPDLNAPVLQRAFKHFGSIENKTIIDLGCGREASSLFFAYHGVNVISVDSSKVAIANLSQYCQDNNIQNITPTQAYAWEIGKLGQVGRFVSELKLFFPNNFFNIVSKTTCQGTIGITLQYSLATLFPKLRAQISIRN